MFLFPGREEKFLKKNRPKRARRIQSFNIDDLNIDKIQEMAQEDGLNRSEWVNRLVATEHASRRIKRDLDKGIQTTLEVHTMDAAHRAKRPDGKCNPHSMNGRCKTCWGDE